jgi:dTDP-4-amino-4,6-dideoxygalactose transaminase
MFPLHIDQPTPHFYWLKHLGLPVWRWDEMAVSNCPVAQDYRLHLLHLPCHQSLTTDQMDWMISALQKTLRHPAQGTQ